MIELLRLLTTFTKEANRWISGEEKHEALMQRYRSASAEFKINILKTSPNFRPFEDSDEENPHSCYSNEIEDDMHDLVHELKPMYLSEVRDYVQRLDIFYKFTVRH